MPCLPVLSAVVQAHSIPRFLAHEGGVKRAGVARGLVAAKPQKMKGGDFMDASVVQYRARTVVRLLEFLDEQCGPSVDGVTEFDVLRDRVYELRDLFEPLTDETE